MSNLILPRAVLELHRFTSKDETRSNLNHVRLEFDHDRREVIAIATDGHRMTTITWLWSAECDPGTEPIHLRGGTLKSIASRKERVMLEWYPGNSRGTLHFGPGGYMGCDVDEDVNFPTWREVMPKESGDSPAAVGFNPQYFEEAMAHARKWVLGKPVKGKGGKYKCHGIVAHVGSWDSLGPAKLTAENPGDPLFPRACYVVMPMRM